MNPSPPNSLYIWAGLSLFTLEFGGHVVYLETHPKGVGCSPIRFYILMGRRCSHVVEHEPTSNHVQVVH